MIEIKKYAPCPEAIEFRKKFSTFKEAWEACPRGDWMLWIAAKVKVDGRLLTLAKGKCAETIKHLMKDDRSIKAVEAAIAYGNREIGDKELGDAADAAYLAADASTSYTAAATADASTSYTTAYATAAAVYDATAAAVYDTTAYDTTAYATADAAAAANNAADAAADAKAKNQKQTADICRELLTNEVFKLI